MRFCCWKMKFNDGKRGLVEVQRGLMTESEVQWRFKKV